MNRETVEKPPFDNALKSWHVPLHYERREVPASQTEATVCSQRNGTETRTLTHREYQGQHFMVAAFWGTVFYRRETAEEAVRRMAL